MTRLAVALAAAVLAGGPALAADPPPGRKPAPAPSTYDQRKQSRANLKRIGLACHAHHDAHGHLPADILGKDGKPLLSWRVALLPALEQDFLFAQFKLDEPWDSDHNRRLLPHMPKVLKSPAQAGDRETDTLVQGFAGQAAGFPSGKKVALPGDFPDGTSNTVLVAEAGPGVPWTKPADRPYDPNTPLPAMDGPYADRFLAVFADGAVHDFRWNAPERWYRLAIEPADGLPIAFDELDAPPAPPRTADEKKRAADLRAAAANGQEVLGMLEDERRRLLDRLDKAGGRPGPVTLGDESSLEEWDEVWDRQARRQEALRAEIDRLRDELRKRGK